jgi:AraC-like DNA-binding protein
MTPPPHRVLEKHDEIEPPRGILYPQRRSELGSLRRLAPSSDLAPFVSHYWIITWDLRGHPPQTQETLPHPYVHIAIERGRSGIYGVVKGRFTRLIEGKGRVFGIAFRPGGFHSFTRSPVSRLTNRIVPLGDVFGADGEVFEFTMLAKRSERAMIAVAETFLKRQKPRRDAIAEQLADLVERIAADVTIKTVEAVARASGLSVRSLQRLFSRYVGVSPKWVINRHRLHEAVDRLSRGETVDWTALALDLGYFDQAHFIKDFKSIIGRTPGDYAGDISFPHG